MKVDMHYRPKIKRTDSPAYFDPKTNTIHAWAYESDKTDLALYFPEGTTEAEVAALVAKSIKERKDLVYEVVKNAELPAAVKYHREMIARGIVF